MSSKLVKSYCRNCSKITNHDVLSEHSVSHRDEYSCDLIYQIVQCRGCKTMSFREVFVDFEAMFLTDDNKWEVPEEVTVYPKAIKWHREVEGAYELPEVVRKIYREIILALKEDIKIISGLGLRGVVEAVCNDLKIPGHDLETKINKLADAGYISKNDAARLHGIRFMGNDAAHDIKTPKDESLKVAVQIVEHLLSSVYILENKVSGNIETTTASYDVFQEILDEKLKEYKAGDELPIAKYLGKDLRRVKKSIKNLEQELIHKITNSEYTKLTIGKLDNYKGSKEKLQHFIVS